ncbi:hypothetical protein B0H14DRAFT_3664054 [Mycena olivaceomarginata]|nr:hypothetical protein B0H14DRAFT_3664054 [Mycena olivaceomarginata]
MISLVPNLVCSHGPYQGNRTVCEHNRTYLRTSILEKPDVKRALWNKTAIRMRNSHKLPIGTEKKTSLCDYMHSTMLDPSMCRGREPDGNQCCCLRCTETTVVDDRTVCKSCGHIETAHPVERPKPGAVIRGLRDAGKLLSNPGSVKTSREEAQAEMSAGLKKKRKSDTDTEPPQPGKKMKGKEREKDNKPSKPKSETTEGEDFAFGKWVLLPCGVRDGELQKTKLPPTQEMEAMRRGGLVLLSTPAKPLSINTAWSSDRINREVQRRFPEVIRYLERKLPKGIEKIPSQLWFGVIKIKQSSKVTLAGDDLPNGASLADHCKAGSASRKKHADRVLYIAELPSVAKIKIPKERYSSWDAPETEAESEELETDIETLPSEDIVMTPRKPARKIKIKKEAESEGNMKNSTKMRMQTRIASVLTEFTGAKQRKPTITIPSSSDDTIPVSSDDENTPVPPEGSPSGSAPQEVVEVSDDEFPPAETLLDGIPPPSALAQAFRSPLFTAKSPSPAPSFSDVPDDSDMDFIWNLSSGEDMTTTNTSLPAPCNQQNMPSSSSSNVFGLASVGLAPAWPGSSSGVTASASTSSAASSTSSNASGASFMFSLGSGGAIASTSTAPSTAEDSSGTSGSSGAPPSIKPRFSRMGRGRAGRNPWATAS